MTGGRNGFGAKLTNIYSTEFKVETVANQKRFVQVFRNHMSEEDKPKVTKATRSKEYTSISFSPDLSLFGMTALDEDTVSLMHRRVIDCAGVTQGVKVYWNGERVDVTDFRDYVALYGVGGCAMLRPSARSRTATRARRVKVPTSVSTRRSCRARRRGGSTP